MLLVTLQAGILDHWLCEMIMNFFKRRVVSRRIVNMLNGYKTSVSRRAVFYKSVVSDYLIKWQNMPHFTTVILPAMPA